jgi:hypothetical protein
MLALLPEALTPTVLTTRGDVGIQPDSEAPVASSSAASPPPEQAANMADNSRPTKGGQMSRFAAKVYSPLRTP